MKSRFTVVAAWAVGFFLLFTCANFINGVEGDELFSICYNFIDPHAHVVAIAHPGGEKPEIPRFVGQYNREGEYIADIRPAGIHVSAKDGSLWASTQFERDTKPIINPWDPTAIASLYSAFHGKPNGGLSVLRKYTSKSPNGVMDFSMGWQDSLFATAPGPALSGDCRGNLYHLDRGNGHLVKMEPVGQTPRVSTVMGTNRTPLNELQSAVQGLAYSPFTQKFYSAAFGYIMANATDPTWENDYWGSQAVLYVTQMDPAAKTSETWNVLLDEELATKFVDVLIPTEDALEVSEDGKSLWLIVSFTTGSDVKSTQTSSEGTIGKKKHHHQQQEEEQQEQQEQEEQEEQQPKMSLEEFAQHYKHKAQPMFHRNFNPLHQKQQQEEEKKEKERSGGVDDAESSEERKKRGADVYFTGFLKIDLLSHTYQEGSFFYGTICSGLTHSKNLCSSTTPGGESW